MSKKAIALPRFELGEPVRPAGLPRATRNAWATLAGELLSARKLSRTDGALLLEWIQVRADRYKGTGARKEAARLRDVAIAKIFADRPAFPEPTVAAPVQVTNVLTLEAFVEGIKSERASFDSRLVPKEPVLLDSDGTQYAWPEGDAAQVARDYANHVINGDIVSGQLVVLACKRFIDELTMGHERGFFFDPVAARNIVAWFKNYITEWQIQPWQIFIVVNLFAWKWASGLRRFFIGWIATGRKSGKSSLLAALGMFCLCADLVDRAEVYSAGTKVDQSKIIWKDARHITKTSPELSAAVRTLQNSIQFNESTFLALSSDFHLLDGLRPSCCLIDEIHEHKSDALTMRLQSGTLSRSQPIQVSATTAGEDRDSWCYSQHEMYERFLRGVAVDHAFFDKRFVYIAMLDEGDDPRKEELWAKANPNIGASMTLEGLRTQAEALASDPQSIFAFQRFHCNIWNSIVASHSLPQDAIAECVGCIPAGRNAVKMREDFLDDAFRRQFKFYAGFDLGLNDDLASFVLIAPKYIFPGTSEPKTIFVPWFWVPEGRILEHERIWRVPLQLWIREGWIKVCGKDYVDLDVIKTDLAEISKKWKVKECGFDAWRFEVTVSELNAMRVFKSVLVPQLPSILTTPCQELKRGVIKRTIGHLGNPVFRWMLGNVDLEPSEKTGGIKPSKAGDDRRNKIDAISAAVTGMNRYLNPDVNPPDPRTLKPAPRILTVDTPNFLKGR